MNLSSLKQGMTATINGLWLSPSRGFSIPDVILPLCLTRAVIRHAHLSFSTAQVRLMYSTQPVFLQHDGDVAGVQASTWPIFNPSGPHSAWGTSSIWGESKMETVRHPQITIRGGKPAPVPGRHQAKPPMGLVPTRGVGAAHPTLDSRSPSSRGQLPWE
jgi:hypothetical protein